MSEIKNQHQQVLWYLINWKSFSLKEVIEDSMFHKFQTRLGEIEMEHGLITEKSKRVFTNRFGRKSYYTMYECSNIDKSIKLMSKY